MNRETLQNLEVIGLSPAEAQVYLALTKLVVGKAGQIIPMVEISSSNVHEALEKLSKKGLISFVIKNNIKEYHAVEPQMLKLLIDKDKMEIKYKEDKLNLLLRDINLIEKTARITESSGVFLGFEGVKSGFKKLFSQNIKDKEYVFFYKATEKDLKIVHEFFSKMDIEDYYKKIPTRALFSENYRGLFRQRKNNKIEAKFTNNPIPSSINVYGNGVLIIAWQDKPIAFLIQSSEVTQTFYRLFEDIWKLAKK